jgi:uncharacterized damage-inducible protein DinB
MISTAYGVTMARYNSWMNRKLFDLCAGLTDDVRKRDLQAFFRSIHGTLDHILAVDLMFLAHFKEGKPRFLPEGHLYEDFSQMCRRREEIDAEMLGWAGAVSSDWLAEPAPFTHHEDGERRFVTRGFWVVQMFNHQTHHRGQVTTLFTQLGHDIGSTDMPMSVPKQDAGSAG